jgi:hypothetical protein
MDTLCSVILWRRDWRQIHLYPMIDLYEEGNVLLAGLDGPMQSIGVLPNEGFQLDLTLFGIGNSCSFSYSFISILVIFLNLSTKIVIINMIYKVINYTIKDSIIM